MPSPGTLYVSDDEESRALLTNAFSFTRCQVGDLSGRHGKISVGGKAYVYNDVNLPLSGDWYTSAIGKL